MARLPGGLRLILELAGIAHESDRDWTGQRDDAGRVRFDQPHVVDDDCDHGMTFARRGCEGVLLPGRTRWRGETRRGARLSSGRDHCRFLRGDRSMLSGWRESRRRVAHGLRDLWLGQLPPRGGWRARLS